MSIKHMKSYFTTCITKEMQIKTIIAYHCTAIRITKIWNADNTKCCCGCREQECSFMAGGDAEW